MDFRKIRSGYMELPDIEALLKKNGIYEKIIFYGVEDITTANPAWRLFSICKKLSANSVQFRKLPAGKLHGVVTRLEM